MGIVVVEICDASLINEVDVEQILESEYSEVSVVKYDCLSFCGLCRVRPYAMVNGTRVFGKTAEECLKAIRSQIDEELAFYMD
ncbi:DUF1450 domain-containing protein [Sediminibacillus dalangtanensis]|uniref:DUF1450 domain-containing protein n=1 Tax=Sediminibacillus dalangtanensis TaxID=2729421 RepID=A0ABX7VPJ6_9BACI|nr:DUF1450 domain-containing protein [Sediminibacillus dalangtanensis]QTM98822.1 DUF1450 domain-containing protein [Sediminibacillus dalangtanensis]